MWATSPLLCDRTEYLSWHNRTQGRWGLMDSLRRIWPCGGLFHPESATRPREVRSGFGLLRHWGELYHDKGAPMGAGVRWRGKPVRKHDQVSRKDLQRCWRWVVVKNGNGEGFDQALRIRLGLSPLAKRLVLQLSSTCVLYQVLNFRYISRISMLCRLIEHFHIARKESSTWCFQF